MTSVRKRWAAKPMTIARKEAPTTVCRRWAPASVASESDEREREDDVADRGRDERDRRLALAHARDAGRVGPAARARAARRGRRARRRPRPRTCSGPTPATNRPTTTTAVESGRPSGVFRLTVSIRLFTVRSTALRWRHHSVLARPPAPPRCEAPQRRAACGSACMRGSRCGAASAASGADARRARRPRRAAGCAAPGPGALRVSGRRRARRACSRAFGHGCRPASYGLSLFGVDTIATRHSSPCAPRAGGCSVVVVASLRGRAAT